MVGVAVQELYGFQRRVMPVERCRGCGIEVSAQSRSATPGAEVGDRFLEVGDANAGLMQAADTALDARRHGGGGWDG